MGSNFVLFNPKSLCLNFVLSNIKVPLKALHKVFPIHQIFCQNFLPMSILKVVAATATSRWKVDQLESVKFRFCADIGIEKLPVLIKRSLSCGASKT